MISMARACQTCIFAIHASNGDYECRRFPPGIREYTNTSYDEMIPRGVWPIVLAYDWCFEWKGESR